MHLSRLLGINERLKRVPCLLLADTGDTGQLHGPPHARTADRADPRCVHSGGEPMSNLLAIICAVSAIVGLSVVLAYVQAGFEGHMKKSVFAVVVLIVLAIGFCIGGK